MRRMIGFFRRRLSTATETFNILTEASDNILTENGDNLIHPI